MAFQTFSASRGRSPNLYYLTGIVNGIVRTLLARIALVVDFGPATTPLDMVVLLSPAANNSQTSTVGSMAKPYFSMFVVSGLESSVHEVDKFGPKI